MKGFLDQDVFGLLAVMPALKVHPAGLYQEIAVIAFHFHWSKEECLNMSRKERRDWIDEIEKINRCIAKSMRPARK